MILISGATGNVGKYLVPFLVEKGASVRVLVRDPRKVAALGNRVEVAVGDLDKPESLPAAMQGIDQLYFVTPVPEQVERLVAAAKEAGVRHVVKQSTIEADRWLGPGKWHRHQEELIKASGMAWTFLRPTLMMSNTIEWWSVTVKSQRSVYFPGGNGDGKVVPVDPWDVAAVAAAVLTQPEHHQGCTYPLTGPEPLSIPEMVEILGNVLGKPIRYVNVPAFIGKFAMLRNGLPRYVANGLMETLAALRRNEYGYVTDCVTQVTGALPRSFEAWCREHAGAFV